MTPDQFRAFQKLMDRQIEAIQSLNKTLEEIKERMPEPARYTLMEK